jgi:hypothetical protein
MNSIVLVVSLIGLTASAPAMASVIFTTGGPPPTFSADPAEGYPIGQPSTGATFTAVAETFTPGATFDLGEIDVAVQNQSGTNELTILIESGASRPTTVLETFITTAPTAAPALVGVTSVLHPTLKKGTKYWLVLTTTGDAVDGWFIDPFGPSGGVKVQATGLPPWTDGGSSIKPAAELLSTTPEPSSGQLTVVCAGLLVVGSLKRKRL